MQAVGQSVFLFRCKKSLFGNLCFYTALAGATFTVQSVIHQKTTYHEEVIIYPGTCHSNNEQHLFQIIRRYACIILRKYSCITGAVICHDYF